MERYIFSCVTGIGCHFYTISSKTIKDLEDTYCIESDIQNRPIIIAIMNEFFADLNVVGDLPVNEEILPFFNSMQENMVKGWTQVPVFGVTMQNHGGYEYEDDNYTKTIALQTVSQEYPKAEQY